MPVASNRLIALAAGTVLDVPPQQIAAVAAAAGFGATGLWFDAETWTSSTTREVARSLDEHGVVALDLEPVILGRGADHGERMIDIAVELGVAHVLVASGPAGHGEVIDRLTALSMRAASSGVTLALEFLPIFSIATLADAFGVVAEVGAPNVGVLVDTLHLDRSGGSVRELLSVDRRLIPYLQVADAPAARPVTREALREEALHGRLLPGDGVLPIAEVLTAVPGVPLSVELRSGPLTARHPDPIERARAVWAACAWMQAA